MEKIDFTWEGKNYKLVPSKIGLCEDCPFLNIAEACHAAGSDCLFLKSKYKEIKEDGTN